jgi:hypothetical protein
MAAFFQHSFGRLSDGLQAGRPVFDIRQGQEIVLFSASSRPAWAHPASYAMDIGGFFFGIKATEA